MMIYHNITKHQCFDCWWFIDYSMCYVRQSVCFIHLSMAVREVWGKWGKLIKTKS